MVYTSVGKRGRAGRNHPVAVGVATGLSFALLLLLSPVASLSSPARGAPLAAPVTRSAAGPDAASILSAVNQFRTDLGGGTTAGPNGSFGGVRREINWDGVPDQFAAPNNLPPNFFNVNSPRGAVFSTPGSGFQVSADAANPTNTPPEFGNLSPAFPPIFTPFSPERLFTALGSTITDVTFFVPGTSTPASVGGFGAVFTDVDSATSTTIEYFDPTNVSLGRFAVPAGPDAGLSFLGVSFNAGERIARVQITSGTVVLNQAGTGDAVAMDDFIYSEPQGLAAPPIVPELSTVLMFGSGLAGLGGYALTRARARRAGRRLGS